MSRVNCVGWWEQLGYGRQAMEHLVLAFGQGWLSGTGYDVIGPFRLDGVCRADQVFITKQYIDRHAIEYMGTTDGEGVYRGDWRYQAVTGGRWLIRVSAGIDGMMLADETTKLL